MLWIADIGVVTFEIMDDDLSRYVWLPEDRRGSVFGGGKYHRIPDEHLWTKACRQFWSTPQRARHSLQLRWSQSIGQPFSRLLNECFRPIGAAAVGGGTSICRRVAIEYGKDVHSRALMLKFTRCRVCHQSTERPPQQTVGASGLECLNKR